MTSEQAYRVLGLTPGCNECELSRRFRQLALQAHPDAGGSDERFSELSHAYAVAVGDLSRDTSQAPISTHTTSLSGRLRRLRRQARRQLGVALAHIHTSGGHP